MTWNEAVNTIFGYANRTIPRAYEFSRIVPWARPLCRLSRLLFCFALFVPFVVQSKLAFLFRNGGVGRVTTDQSLAETEHVRSRGSELAGVNRV